ncbi:hypothetical protein THAOC_28906, partial [Thalassiosira oceanica]
MVEGVHQGAVESSWYFSITCNRAFQNLREYLAPSGGGVQAIIDDNYSFGRPDVIFEANKAFAADLAIVGLELQSAKSQCYIRPGLRDSNWDALRGDIPNGLLRDSSGEAVLVDGTPQYGITVCNVPVGEQAFVEGYLAQRLTRITDGYQRAKELLDPGRWPCPDVPTRQMLWILTVACFQFMGDYWLRHVRPDFTGAFARGIDSGVWDLVQACVGTDTSKWTDIALARARLPMRERGCNLRGAADRRFAQFVGCLGHSAIALIDRTDSDGNMIPGRLNLPSVVGMLGEGTFNHPIEAPWGTLLNESSPSSNLAAGLKYSWHHLQSSFQEASPPMRANDGSLLLNQDASHAGFYPDGSFARSITNAITCELERSRAIALDETITSTLPRKSYERWAWEGWGQTSAMFLQSPPDELGHLGDNEFPVAFATYLGQACPAVAPLVGRYFGKKGTVLDEFGANLAAASLPGQGHRRLHNLLQGLLQSMMELGGVYSTKEAVNFLLGHVPDPFISRYIRHVSQCPNARNAPFGMIPDLHAQNYPTGRQRVNDSGSHLSAEAIFEVKTFVACNSRYGNNNSQISPANRRAKQVCQTYVLKTKKLDNKFAPEIVGDGTGNVVGPVPNHVGPF